MVTFLKRALVIFAAAFSLNANAIFVPQGQNTMGFGQTYTLGPSGSFSFSPTAAPGSNGGIIYLHCGPPATGAGNDNYPCRKAGSLYHISANKNLVCGGTVWSAGANNNFQFMYATATFPDATATPTGAVYEGGTAHSSGVRATGAAYTPTPVAFIWPSDATGFWPGIDIPGGVILNSDLACLEI